MTESGFPRRAVVVLGLGLSGMGLTVGGFGTYVNRLIASGVSPGLAGLGSTLFLLGQLLVVYPADLAGRRWSIRYAAAAGLTMATVGALTSGVVSLPVNLLSRICLGLGMGTTFISAMKYAGRRAQDGDVARVQGLLGAGFTLGLAIGIPVMPVAVRTTVPVAPGVVAAVPVAIAAVLATTLAPVSRNGRRPLAAYVDAFLTPTGLALGLANASSYGFLIVATTWYTDVVAGIPVLPLTLVLTGFAVATFVGRTWSGWLATITTERRAVGGALGVLAGALALVVLALVVDSPPALAVGLVLSGAGFGLPFGPLNSLAFSNLGDDAGVLLVGMTALGNGAALVYPWLVGWLLSATNGYEVGFAVMSLSVLAVTVVWQRVILSEDWSLRHRHTHR